MQLQIKLMSVSCRNQTILLSVSPCNSEIVTGSFKEAPESSDGKLERWEYQVEFASSVEFLFCFGAYLVNLLLSQVRRLSHVLSATKLYGAILTVLRLFTA